VLKTLVIEQDPPRAKPYIVMAPAEAEVDLKLLAATLGVKRLRMASHADAERLTGLKVGGISALALTGRGFPVLVAASALEHDLVLVSAGTRGADVELRPVDLIALTGARPVPL
jgi:Cys-tRNA(Pro)/Cys-tRNA(Cys) deacylase